MVKLVLGKASPDDLAETLVNGTKLADPKVRLALWKGGADAVTASKDPMIVLARSLEPHTRALRKQMDDDVAAPSRQATEAMAKARFERDGVSSYRMPHLRSVSPSGRLKAGMKTEKPFRPLPISLACMTAQPGPTLSSSPSPGWTPRRM